MDAAEVARFVAKLPGFDAETSPSTGMGVLAEYLRTRAGAVRSAHPLTSFAALGPRAAECTAGHELDCHLGERSPLGWLDRAGGAELLLGLGYAACKSIHLAEYRLPEPRPRARYHCLVSVGGKRMPKSFTAVVLDDSDFEKVGSQLDQEPFVRRGRVAGAADCRLLQVTEAVAFATAWPPFGARRAAA
jgi:aminoglycoside 3-N-acetyltransferase